MEHNKTFTPSRLSRTECSPQVLLPVSMPLCNCTGIFPRRQIGMEQRTGEVEPPHSFVVRHKQLLDLKKKREENGSESDDTGAGRWLLLTQQPQRILIVISDLSRSTLVAHVRKSNRRVFFLIFLNLFCLTKNQ